MCGVHLYPSYLCSWKKLCMIFSIKIQMNKCEYECFVKMLNLKDDFSLTHFQSRFLFRICSRKKCSKIRKLYLELET